MATKTAWMETRRMTRPPTDTKEHRETTRFMKIRANLACKEKTGDGLMDESSIQRDHFRYYIHLYILSTGAVYEC